MDAFVVAATGTRNAIRDAARSYARGSVERRLLDAIGAQREGDVDSAVRQLRSIVREKDAAVAAPAADFLAPIFVMRHATAELLAVVETLDAAGWQASAHVFRALAAAQSGDRRSAYRHSAAAEAALTGETNLIIEVRALQRLASAAYFLNEHAKALDLAVRSGRLAERVGAWHNAAAAYSIAFNVQHDVLEDFAEADRFVQLWCRAARKTDDVSFLQPALVSEFTIAVQVADDARVRSIERELRSLGLTQQYHEHYAFTVAHAMVRGRDDVGAMRTVLEVLKDTSGRSRAQTALCAALIALADAAQRDDDAARSSLREGIARLGRPASTEPAYEQRLRRLARATLAFTCDLIGDHVRATRILQARESGANDALRDLVRGTSDVRPGLRGLRRLFEHAHTLRATSEPPARLTAAEIEVLQLLAHGWSAERIARETNRSRNTVYNHTRSILGKLDASRALEAVAIARQRGFLA